MLAESLISLIPVLALFSTRKAVVQVLGSHPSKSEYLSRIDWKRFPVKIGASGVFGLAGIGSFADAWGVDGVVLYITSLAALRVCFIIPISWMVKRWPEITIHCFRWSPALILLGSISVYLGHLLFLPLALSLYISFWWSHYHSVRELKGHGTESFVDTEVLASICGSIFVLVLTHVYSIQVAAVGGGLLCALGALIPVKVTGEELRQVLQEWESQASLRSATEISNGVTIARAVGTVSFCSLSLLRIKTLDTENFFEGVWSLGITIAGCEAVVWLFLKVLRKNKGEEGPTYGGRTAMALGFAVSLLGFILMAFNSSAMISAGYIAISIVSRSINREVDQEFARSHLRGVDGNPATREIEKFVCWLVLTPLLLHPQMLVPAGIAGSFVLINCNFSHPRDRKASG